jgi:hypothetical protein
MILESALGRKIHMRATRGGTLKNKPRKKTFMSGKCKMIRNAFVACAGVEKTKSMHRQFHFRENSAVSRVSMKVEGKAKCSGSDFRSSSAPR